MTNITLPKEFLSAVKIQKNEHKALKGVLFDCKDGATNIVASDTKALKRYTLNSSSNDNCTQLIYPEWLKAYIKENKIRAKGGVYSGINVMQEIVGYDGDKHINARYPDYKNIIPDNFIDILNLTKEQVELLRAKENLKAFMMVLCYIEAESKKAKFALVNTISNIKKDMFEVNILVEPVNFDRNIFLSFDLFAWATCESETITMCFDAQKNDMCLTPITLKNGNDLVISMPYLKDLTYKDFKGIDMDSDSCKIIAEVSEAMDIYSEQAFVKLSDGGYCFVCSGTNKAIKLNGLTPDIVLQTLNKEYYFKKTDGGNFIENDINDSIFCKGIYHIASIKLNTDERAFINSIRSLLRNFLYINNAKVAYLGDYGFADLNNRAFISTSCQKICLSCDFTIGSTIDVYAIDSNHYAIFTNNKFYIVSNKFSERDYAQKYEKFIERDYSKIDIDSTKEYIAKNAAMTKESCVAKLLDNSTQAFIDDNTSRIVRLLISGDYFYFLIKEPITFGFSKGDSKNDGGNIESEASESESVESSETNAPAPENCKRYNDLSKGNSKVFDTLVKVLGMSEASKYNHMIDIDIDTLTKSVINRNISNSFNIYLQGNIVRLYKKGLIIDLTNAKKTYETLCQDSMVFRVWGKVANKISIYKHSNNPNDYLIVTGKLVCKDYNSLNTERAPLLYNDILDFSQYRCYNDVSNDSVKDIFVCMDNQYEARDIKKLSYDKNKLVFLHERYNAMLISLNGIDYYFATGGYSFKLREKPLDKEVEVSITKSHYNTLESLNEIDLNDSEAYSKIFNLYHSVKKQEWYFGKSIVQAIIKSVLLNNFYDRCSNMTPCVCMPELINVFKMDSDSFIAGHYKSIEAIQTYYVFNELKVGANSNNQYIQTYYAIVNAILDYKNGKATPMQSTLLELLAMETPQNNTSRIKTYREVIMEAWDTFIKKRFNSEKLEFVESLVGNRIEWAGDYCAHIKSYKGDLVAVVELDSDNNVLDLDIRIPIKKYYEHITFEQVELLYRLMELEYKTKKSREEAVNV